MYLPTNASFQNGKWTIQTTNWFWWVHTALITKQQEKKWSRKFLPVLWLISDHQGLKTQLHHVYFLPDANWVRLILGGHQRAAAMATRQQFGPYNRVAVLPSHRLALPAPATGWDAPAVGQALWLYYPASWGDSSVPVLRWAPGEFLEPLNHCT